MLQLRKTIFNKINFNEPLCFVIVKILIVRKHFYPSQNNSILCLLLGNHAFPLTSQVLCLDHTWECTLLYTADLGSIQSCLYIAFLSS